MSTRYITLTRGDTVLTIEGYIDPPDYEVGWNGDYVIETVRVETYTDISELLSQSVFEGLRDECFETIMNDAL